MAIFKDNEIIHRFTILNLSHIDSRGRKFYNVVCQCGNKKVINGSLIKSGNTKSCGCFATEVRKATRKPNNHGEITSILLGYKKHAKNRGFKFLLTREEFESIIRKPCYYCGEIHSNWKKTKNSIEGFRYNGIDRVDSSKHYTADNIVPCCKFCNLAKRDMSQQDFLSKIKQIYEWSNL